MKIPTLACVFVRYTGHYNKRASALISLLLFLLPMKTKLVVVDTFESLPEAPKGSVHLRNDNQLHEFGAWQQGVDFLETDSEFENAALLLVNDTFCHHHDFGFWTFFAVALSCIQVSYGDSPRVSGFISTSSDKIFINNTAFQYWISTYLFAVSASALTELRRRIVPVNFDENEFLCELDSEPLGLINNDQHRTLKDKIESWLTLSGSSTPKWRRAEVLTRETHPRLRCKARSIILEFLFQSRCMSGSIEILPMNKPFVSWIIRRGKLKD